MEWIGGHTIRVRDFSLFCPIVFSPFDRPLTHKSFFQYRLLFAHFSQVEPANFTNGTKAEANGQIAGIEGERKELIIHDIILKTKKKSRHY